MQRQTTTAAAVFLTLAATLFSSAASAASSFVLESPGVVLDTVANLEWEQDAGAQGLNINGVDIFGAQAYVDSLGLDPARGPWRLPTAAELTALYADLKATGFCLRNVICTGDIAPFTSIQDGYWSSTASSRPGAYMQAVSFISGAQGPVPTKQGVAVWAVRANPPSSVPEPASGMLAIVGMALICAAAKRFT